MWLYFWDVEFSFDFWDPGAKKYHMFLSSRNISESRDHTLWIFIYIYLIFYQFEDAECENEMKTGTRSSFSTILEKTQFLGFFDHTYLDCCGW